MAAAFALSNQIAKNFNAPNSKKNPNKKAIEKSGPEGKKLVKAIRKLTKIINITFDPNISVGDSSFNNETGEIVIGGKDQICVANSDGSAFTMSRRSSLSPMSCN